jgi:hypothetical protein
MVTTRSTRRAALAVIGAGLLAAGCGGSTEEGLERLIESQVSGDVDIDLGDGGFSVDSEDGSFSVDADGNFVVEGEDGQVITGNADGDGNFTVEGEDGEVITGSGDGDGDFTVEGEDGSFSVDSSGELPDEWPDDIPTPDDFAIEGASVIESPDGAVITLAGSSSLVGEDFVAAYGSALEGAGLENLGEFSSPDSASASYQGADWSITVAASAGENEGISITVFPNT